MNGDFRMDMDEILRNIRSAEIVCVYFPLLRKTLVVDTRTDVEDPPVVRLLPMANSIEERFRALRKLRPRFPQPDKVAIIPWPKYVDSLVRLGIWDKLVQRCAATGHAGSVKACKAALEELRALERAELVAVITGDQYHTIWQAPKR